MTYWLNGVFQNEPHAISIADRGFLLGDGVFETILVIDGVPVFWDEHLERISCACEALGIVGAVEELSSALVAELAARNALNNQTAALRLTISRGAGARGLLAPPTGETAPTILLTIAPYVTPPRDDQACLTISRWRRNEHSVGARYKTLNYLDNTLARNEAADKGFDDAILLNSAGRAACVSAGNLFLVEKNGRVVTPGVEEGALPGIVRGQLLKSASMEGIVIEEAPIEAAQLGDATLFFTNSLMGIVPAALKSNSDPAGNEGLKIINRLQSWYQSIVQVSVEGRAGEN